MQNVLTTRTIEAQAKISAPRKLLPWSVVASYHDENIVQKMMSEYSLTREHAIVLFEDTKKFLYLCALYPGRFGPTQALDRGWHTFILFTREYADFCKRYLGRFVHHAPIVRYEGSTALGEPVAHSTLLQYAQLEFGDNLSENWVGRTRYNECDVPDTKCVECKEVPSCKDCQDAPAIHAKNCNNPGCNDPMGNCSPTTNCQDA